MTVLLEKMEWPKDCEGISHPDTKYTVYYKLGSKGDRCSTDRTDCDSQVRKTVSFIVMSVTRM